VKIIINYSPHNFQNLKEKEKIKTLDGAFEYISQLEEKLKRSQEQEKKFRKLKTKYNRIQSILETTHDFISYATPDRKILYINEGGIEMIGKDKAWEYKGKNASDLHPIWANEIVLNAGIPNAVKKEFWVGETALLKGKQEIPVSQIIMAHKTDSGKLEFLSTIMRDISKKKTNESKLNESNKKYKSLFENLPSAFAYHEIILDSNNKPVDYRFIEANPMFEQMLGMKAKDIIGKTVVEILPGIEKDPADWIGKYGKVALSGEQLVFEDYAVLLDKWFRITAYSPKKNFFATTVTDITEEKKIQDQIKESEIKFSKAFMANPNLFAITKLDDGIFMDINDSFVTTLGFTRSEVIGQSAATLNILSLESRNNLKNMMLRDRIISNFEINFYTKSGKKHIGLFSAELINIRNENCLISSLNDITDQRQIEKQLKEKEEKYKNLVETSTDLIFSEDLEGKLIYVNPAFSKTLGYSKEVFLHQNTSHLIHPEDLEEVIKAKQLLLAGKTIRNVEYRIKAMDGQYHYFSTNASPLFDSEGNVREFYGVGRDVTEVKIMELERLQSQKMDSVGILAGGLAHDFNNILVGVLGNVTLIQHSEENLSSKILEMLDNISEAAKKATNLTRQLLTFSKGGAPIKKAENIEKIIGFSMKLVMSGSKSICRFLPHGEIPPVDVDVGQIEQIINNLLLNADQAMRYGGIITIALSQIQIKELDKEIMLKPGSYVKISISDQGTGIPPHVQEKIFTPYFSTKPKGTGLGLATAYSIIKKHDGKISFFSRENVGTTFNIFLPVSKLAVKIDEKETEIILSKRGKILVLDDNGTILKLLKKMLLKLNQKVDLVTDGVHVIQKYEEALQRLDPYDIVIMDLTIPGGMGGKDTIEALLKIDPNVKAIVSSGYFTNPVIANFSKYKFKGVLQKPFTFNDIKIILSKWL
jgi:PAS domain S-box-containing protein